MDGLTGRALGRWLNADVSVEPPAGGVAGSLADDLRCVIGAWIAAGAHSAQTLERMGEVAVRFARRVTATGRSGWSEVDEQDCAEFVEAPVQGRAASVATLHFRRTTLRCVFRTLRDLGIVSGEPTVDLVLPPRTPGKTRPLSDDEMTLLRTAAVTTGRDRGRNASIVALAEATAITSEVALVRVEDLDDPAAPATVALPGNRRARPRTGHLTDWGRSVLARRVATVAAQPGDGRLAYGGAAGPDAISGQASVCNALGVLLGAVGLDLEADVRPVSVRHWAGRSIYDRGGAITDVALALGCNSLDAAAVAIGLDWQAQR